MTKKYYLAFVIRKPENISLPDGIKGVMMVYKTRKQAEEENPDVKIWVIEERVE